MPWTQIRSKQGMPLSRSNTELQAGGTAVSTTMDTASPRDTLIPEADFFDLLDEVLGLVGRAPLAPGGPEQAIIGVRPEDRVLQILAGAG